MPTRLRTRSSTPIPDAEAGHGYSNSRRTRAIGAADRDTRGRQVGKRQRFAISEVHRSLPGQYLGLA